MMDEEIERMVVSVRADTAAFARDVATMRGELEGPLASGAGRAGRLIESSLGRAMLNGKLGFDDLKRAALSAMAQIAQASLRGLFSPSGQSTSGSASLFSAALSGLLGLPAGPTADRFRQGAAIWSANAGRNCSCPRPAEGSSRQMGTRGRCACRSR